MHPPEREAVGAERWVVGIVAAVMLVGFGVEVFGDFTPAKASILVMLVAMPFLLVLHELGHVVAATLLGWKICRIVIGYGRSVAKLRVLGIPTEIRLLPIAGHVLPAPLELRRPRLENTLIYAAGPGAELLLVLVLALLIGPATLIEPATSLGVIAAQSVALLVAIDLFTNLVPLPAQSEGGTVWTDGLGMVLSPFLPQSHFQRALTLPWVLRAEDCEHPADRVAVYEAGLARHPENAYMRWRLIEELRKLDPIRAHAEFQALRASGELPPDLGQ